MKDLIKWLKGMEDAAGIFYADAAKAFETFAEAYPRSPLASEARFGKALAQAMLGDKPLAIASFESFLKQDAQHPLAKDAEIALAALR